MAKRKRPLWSVVVYEIRDFGRIFLPGEVLRFLPDEEGKWRPYIDNRAIVKCPTKKKATATSEAIADGSFQLAPDKTHSIAHGGFGKPKRK